MVVDVDVLDVDGEMVEDEEVVEEMDEYAVEVVEGEEVEEVVEVVVEEVVVEEEDE